MKNRTIAGGGFVFFVPPTKTDADTNTIETKETK
jgi:hypothetical protein